MESAGTSILVVTPAGESPTALGGAELGPLGMSAGRADEGAEEDPVVLVRAPSEHPVAADKPLASTTAPHSKGR